MNAGIDWIKECEAEEPECRGYSYNWLLETGRMVDRGWRLFWRKRHMKPPPVSATFAETAHMEVASHLGRSD